MVYAWQDDSDALGILPHQEVGLIGESLDVLDDDECRRLLATASLGRVGVSMGALPAIFPVSFRLVGDAIVFRCSYEAKLRAALDHTVVAFQADAVDPVRDAWWSVQAVGLAERLDEDDDTSAIAQLWVPGSSRQLGRIRPEYISGRRSATDHRLVEGATRRKG